MKGWAYRDGPDGLLHARPGVPDRWDVAVRRGWHIGPVSRRRLARAIRQDIWRAAQSIRGFVPRVAVATSQDHIDITAGGVLMAGAAPGLDARVASILDNPNNKRRWLAFAAPKGEPCSRKS